eukprot:Rmarinus@m.20835
MQAVISGESSEFIPAEQGTKADRIFATDESTAPESYRTNSTKENLILEYIEHFEHQFGEMFPDLVPLFLVAKNECNIRKFVCTTIRPTQLAYKELYDMRTCAEWLANFTAYEPLMDAQLFPEFLPSPASVITWRIGDCFDLSTLLVSLLLGVGYDAYCVLGTAPKHITLRDQSQRVCPLQETKKNQSEDNSGKSDERSTYLTKDLPVLESRFVKMLEERKQKEKAKLETGENGENAEPADNDGQEGQEEKVDEPNEPEDALHRCRVHCWVLVMAGRREVPTPLFIEPSTGAITSVDDSEYLNVKSVWNHQNYWINLQGIDAAPADISYNLLDSNNWEYIFLDTEGLDPGNDGADMTLNLNDTHPPSSAGAGDDAGGPGLTSSNLSVGGGGGAGADSTKDGDKDKEEEQVLDLPRSWSGKIHIPRDVFVTKYQSEDTTAPGHKIIDYLCAKLELFADYKRDDGMVSRLTKYSDRARTLEVEVRETFAHRKDKLVVRARYPLEEQVNEWFDPGRSFGLRSLCTVGNKQREITFYPTARLDGLVARKDIFGVKSTETFQDRDDKLAYRSVHLTPPDNEKSIWESRDARRTEVDDRDFSSYRITKMTEKFERDLENATATKPGICKRNYYVEEGKIRIEYHCAPGTITRSNRVYCKDGTTQITQVDPFEKPPKKSALLDEYHSLLTAEKDCGQAVREAAREARDIVQTRVREEQGIHLHVSIYDTIRNRPQDSGYEDRERGDDGEAASKEYDYLAPFLVHRKDGQPLAKLKPQQAQEAREMCLRALKDRLIERANIIQSRLQEEQDALSKRQSAFQRNRDHVDKAEEEEFEQYVQEASFRIHILDQRLARHEEQALQKYAELDRKLRSDPRLACIYND